MATGEHPASWTAEGFPEQSIVPPRDNAVEARAEKEGPFARNVGGIDRPINGIEGTPEARQQRLLIEAQARS